MRAAGVSRWARTAGAQPWAPRSSATAAQHPRLRPSGLNSLARCHRAACCSCIAWVCGVALQCWQPCASAGNKGHCHPGHCVAVALKQQPPLRLTQAGTRVRVLSVYSAVHRPCVSLRISPMDAGQLRQPCAGGSPVAVACEVHGPCPVASPTRLFPPVSARDCARLAHRWAAPGNEDQRMLKTAPL